MAKWARVENGIVMETTDIDPAGRFHPDFIWYACAEEVDQRWHYADGVFTPPEN